LRIPRDQRHGRGVDSAVEASETFEKRLITTRGSLGESRPARPARRQGDILQQPCAESDGIEIVDPVQP
jgi:hypothetical protein